jgi:hypothetical protein
MVTKKNQTIIKSKRKSKSSHKPISRKVKIERDKDKVVKKYYRDLLFDKKQDCIKKVNYYTHPKNDKLQAVFPFIINYDEANNTIFRDLLEENTGININDWLLINKKKDKHNSKTKTVKKNEIDLFKDIKQEISFKLQSSVYELISHQTVINTFNYIFQKFDNGIYVQIKDNKVKYFTPFINMNFVNNWADLIKLPKKYASLEDYYLAKKKILGLKINLEKNKDLWTASNCSIETIKRTNINDSKWSEIYQMITETCENHKVADVEFFMNLKSFPLLRNDFTEPFNYIFGENKFLTSQYYTSYQPILSISSNEQFGDLTYPSAEDWRLITKEYYRNACENKNVMSNCGDEHNQHQKKNFDEYDVESHSCVNNILEWDEKINKLYYLGDSAGCGITINNNPRLKLIEIGMKNKDLMEVSLSRYSKSDKLNPRTQEMGFFNAEETNLYTVGNKIGKHGKYKYLISVPSYTIDPDLGFYLSMGGLVFKVDSDYSSWYDNLLKPYQHYLPIKKDLSNLVPFIKWANKNPDSAQKIARNGYIAYKKFFNRKVVLNYWSYLLNSISNHRLDLSSLEEKFQEYESQVKVITPLSIPPPDLGKINFKNYKLGIIIPYYELDNKYKVILQEFIDSLTNELKNIPKLKFKIIVCEQFRDNRKFNKGQLANLGILIAKSYNCSHVIITNINKKINSSIIQYYLSFNETDRGVVNIGFDWNSYYQKKYLNDICLWKLDLLIKIGGYPNQIWGWGCADKILYHRFCKYASQHKLPNGKWNIFIPIFKNKFDIYELGIWGQIIDPQYQHLKMLNDWYIEKYEDLDILEKYIDEIINIHKKSSEKKTQTKKNILQDDFSMINNDTDHTNEDLNKSERFKTNLKIIDKYQHQKDVEHYTFKLISQLNTL